MKFRTIFYTALFCTVVAPLTYAQRVFDLSTFHPYVNTPTLTATGTLLVHNTNPRPPGSQAYLTGVATAAMPSYAAGDTLQWAMLARSTTTSNTTVNFGVQTGNGDENNLSL